MKKFSIAILAVALLVSFTTPGFASLINGTAVRGTVVAPAKGEQIVINSNGKDITLNGPSAKISAFQTGQLVVVIYDAKTSRIKNIRLSKRGNKGKY